MDEAAFQRNLARGRWDVGFFSKTFLGITPHPGQERVFKTALMRTPSGWRAAYLTLAISAGNRAGKTLGLAILIVHNCVYKMGMKPPNPGNPREMMAWAQTDYEWYHFGIQQETADLVFHEIVRIFNGTHEAQRGHGCPITDLLGKEVIKTDRKFNGDYPWVVFHRVLGGAQIHFRSTGERAIGSLGKDMHGISFDECAFEPQLEFVVNEVLHLRRLGTGGQLFLISTATEGLTAFADLWFEGDPDAPERKSGHYSLRMSTRDNIGYGLDEVTFNRLVEAMPEYLIPQNIDGGFIESRSAFFGSQAVDASFTEDLPPEQLPKRNHRYTQGVDPAITFDSTYAITLDITDPLHVTGVRIRRKTGRQTTTSVTATILEGHRLFNTRHTVCATHLDATGFGGKTFQDLLRGVHPFHAVEMGGTRSKKTKLLLDLKGMIEKGRLRLPREGAWLTLRRQLLGYRLEDRKLQTDAVIALALAVREAVRIGNQPIDNDPTLSYFGPELPRRGDVHSLPARAVSMGTVMQMPRRR